MLQMSSTFTIYCYTVAWLKLLNEICELMQRRGIGKTVDNSVLFLMPSLFMVVNMTVYCKY